MRNKHVRIHLHLDAPAREDPWLEEPEADPRAAPFLDGTERDLQQCWGPLSAAAREGGFDDLWALCGLDAAPALLELLSRRAPRLHDSLTRSPGALATAAPSLILPLASEADRRAAVRWGLADFRLRSGREPEGFVPPAGAADDATLEALAIEGLRFVLLPARAAARVREPGGDWLAVSPESLDCARPYLWRGRSGRSLAVFFTPPGPDLSALFARDRALSRGSAASGALGAADRQGDPEAAGAWLATKLVDSLRVNDAAELAHAAFDASWFGARWPRGERALAAALAALSREAPAESSSHARFLDLFPPPQEVELRPYAAPAEDAWRGPFRAALEGLSAELAGRERAAWAPLARDPEAAVDASGRLAFAFGLDRQRAFLDEVLARHPRPEEAVRALRLAELSRWRLRSLARWGLEDADPAGPEAAHALRCAARALDLAALLFGPEAAAIEKRFIAALSAVPSSGTPFPNAAAVYQRLAVPARSGPERAAAHAAAADHLAHEPEGLSSSAPSPVWEVSVRPLFRRSRREGKAWRSLSVSLVTVFHRRTLERWEGLAAARRRSALDLEVRLAAGVRDPGAAARLDAAFLGGQDEAADALSAALDAACGPASWSLDALTPSARRLAARVLGERGAPERRARLSAASAAARRGDWAAALGALEPEDAPDSLPFAPPARAAVVAAAEDFAARPGPEAAGRLEALLSAAEACGLHLPLWELRRLAQGAAGRLAELLGLPREGGVHGHA